jgi:diguanylate cyclase (GGDEF)-like protein
LVGAATNELESIRALIVEARAIRTTNPARGIEIAADAVTRARSLLAQHRANDTIGLLADALAVKGHCHRMSSALAEAATHCSEAVALFESIDSRYAESLARSQWGASLVMLGDLTGGLAQMERSLALSKALGNEEHVCDCLLDIGVVNNMLGNDARAIELYAQAQAFYEKSGDHYHHATCLSNAANAHTCWGRRERQHHREESALAHFREAQALARRAIALAKLGDDLDFLSLRYVTLAEAEREAGDLQACLNTLATQLPLTEKLVGKRTQARCLNALAGALIERAEGDDEARALSHLRDADALCEAHSLVEAHSSVLSSLAKFHEKFNRPADALAAYKRFHEIEIRIRTEAAERDNKTLEARLRVEHVQQELDRAKEREAELTALNTRLRDQQYALERLAHVDPLTGLANRRAWLASLELAWAAGKDDLYVYLLDLDHFKEINDTHGHRIGDEVLVAVARIVKTWLGGEGEVGRFGGEEFVAWLRTDEEAIAAQYALRLLESVRSHAWKTIENTLQVTGSLGWCAGGTHETPFDALSEADRNMYRAKHAGRDQVIGTR